MVLLIFLALLLSMLNPVIAQGMPVSGSGPASAALPSQALTPPHLTDHTIIVDGDLSDWSADEMMETDAGGGVYITWDEENLYLGIGNLNITDDGAFLVYFDTTAGGSTTSYDFIAHGNHSLPFEADFGLAVDEAASMEWVTWNGASWTSSAYTHTSVVGTAASPDSEFLIPPVFT